MEAKNFSFYVKATDETSQPWETGTAKHGVTSVSIPTEFDGPGTAYSPEDFYAFALGNCYVATFKLIALKSKFEFKNIDIKGVLTVDKNEVGFYMMKKIHFEITLWGVKDPEAAKRMFEKTSRSCMILNSTLTEKTYSYNVIE